MQTQITQFINAHPAEIAFACIAALAVAVAIKIARYCFAEMRGIA